MDNGSGRGSAASRFVSTRGTRKLDGAVQSDALRKK
jgi:hypothetical protein